MRLFKFVHTLQITALATSTFTYFSLSIILSLQSLSVLFSLSLSLFSPFNFLSRSHSLLCCSEHSVCVCVYFLLCSLMPVRIYFRVMGVVLAIKYEKRAIPFALGVVSSCLSWTLRKNVDIFLYTIFFFIRPALVRMEVTASAVCILQPLKTMPTIKKNTQRRWRRTRIC